MTLQPTGPGAETAGGPDVRGTRLPKGLPPGEMRYLLSEVTYLVPSSRIPGRRITRQGLLNWINQGWLEWSRLPGDPEGKKPGPHVTTVEAVLRYLDREEAAGRGQPLPLTSREQDWQRGVAEAEAGWERVRGRQGGRSPA